MSSDRASSSGDSGTDPQDAAVAALEASGLTEYRARALVALTRIGEGTAKDVSRVADIPQARVYDCMEALQEQGLVDIRRSKPRLFRAADVETTVETLRRRSEERLDRLERSLSALDPPATDDEDDHGPWTTTGREAVVDRIRSLVADADRSVALAVAAPDLVDPDLLSTLEAAVAGGVDVVVGSPDADLRSTLASRLDGATVTETWAWWDRGDLPPRDGEVTAALIVDDRATLTAVADHGGDDHRAVWASDPDSALVGTVSPTMADAVRGRLESVD